LIGAAAGVIAGGLIGNMIDQQQQQQLQQQYPQTWNKLQNNDAVYANSPSSLAPPATTAANAGHSAATISVTGSHSSNAVNTGGDHDASNAAAHRGRHQGACCGPVLDQMPSIKRLTYHSPNLANRTLPQRNKPMLIQKSLRICRVTPVNPP
jgi:hypothetical protein